MKILITNDDGILAGGIQALEQVAGRFGETITIAPDRALSGCAHQLTLDRKLVLTQVAENRFQLDGTPADCVRVAIAEFGTFDWVLSGINQGANLGVDIFVSGTVAAAREASQMSIPAIALSQYRLQLGKDPSWEASIHHAARVLPELFQRVLNPGQYWNVNFPDLADSADPEMIDCCVDKMALPVDYHRDQDQFRFSGDYHERTRKPGSDVDQCFSGKITISRV